MPLDYESNITYGVPPTKYNNPPAYNQHVGQYVKDLQGSPTNLTPKYITRLAHGEKIFLH